MRRTVTISTRFAILLVGIPLACLAPGCGTAFWSTVSQSGEAAKPAKGEPPGDAKGDDKNADDKKGDEKKDEPGEEKIPGHVDVRCVTVRRLSFAITVDGLGRTEPLPECVGSLTATVEGHVHQLFVRIGDTVKANQPILQLDPTVAKATLAEKEANRDSLVAALKLLESLPRPEERRAAELAVETAKIGVEHDQAQVDSLRPLLSQKDVSPKQFHDAEVLLKQAEVQRQTAEAQLKLMMTGPRPEAVAEAKTKIAMADEGVASSRATLALHILRAPIAGVVESLNCHPGQTLPIGTPIGEVIDIRRLFVTVYFPARTTRLLQPGMAARVDLSDGGSHPESESVAKDTLVGKVAFIGSAADPQTGNYAVRILMENDGTRLRLGQVVKVNVVLKNEESRIAVPEAAIFDQGEGPLMAVIREGKLKLLHPELGTNQAGNVAVAKTDLKEGEPVVVEGAYGVPDDTDATILPEGPKAAASADTKDAADSKVSGESKGADHEKVPAKAGARE
jgi:multidrug efflux pump subunit AcrA (membrane-fusion protein)